jgi:HK97 family phage major capsid protein
LDALTQAADIVYKNFNSGAINLPEFDRQMNRLENDRAAVEQEKRNTKAVAKYAGSADSAEFNGIGEMSVKGFAEQKRLRPTSMWEIDSTQIKALQQAARQGTPFKVQIGQKGIEHGYLGGVHTKAAVTAGGLTPNLMPPVQQPGDRGFWGLPYELTRVSNFVPNVAMTGPGVAYFRHDSNAAEAGYVTEGSVKPDLSPVVTEQWLRPYKVAGRMLMTHEIVQDAGDEFGDKLINDLTRSIYNEESFVLLNGTVMGNGFNGINNTEGTLTRSASMSDVDQLDTLNKAFVDLRSNFFVPDVVFIHPETLGAIRRLRDQNGRLQLNLDEGPRGVDQTAETENLWGVQLVQTTQQPTGTAAVLSLASGAALVYVREGLTTFFDPYSQSSSNIYVYIAETRLALATPRPGAINLVTGLDPGTGS